MSAKTQMLIRLPTELKSRLKDRAAANNRTATGELLAILERIMKTDEKGAARLGTAIHDEVGDV